LHAFALQVRQPPHLLPNQANPFPFENPLLRVGHSIAPKLVRPTPVVSAFFPQAVDAEIPRNPKEPGTHVVHHQAVPQGAMQPQKNFLRDLLGNRMTAA
jgi:hypothetical protein